MVWTGWGEPFVAATGTESVNDCTPSCAAGHVHSYAVVLVASSASGVTAYTTVIVAFAVKNPTIGAAPSTSSFRCH